MKFKVKNMYLIWGCLYMLCAALGTVKYTQGMNGVLLVLASLLFFVPPALLVIKAAREEKYKLLKPLRWIAISSLALTTALLIGNVVGANASAQLGMALHYLLLLVSVPMLCAQYWVLSLFLWAVLLMFTLPGVIMPKKK